MSGPTFLNYDPTTDLKIEKIVEASPTQMYKAYTTPEFLMKWFCPKPWKVTECEMDLRLGGNFFTKMEGPNGEAFSTSGCFLELIPGKKLVWTDTMISDYRPSPTPFMTAIVTFEEQGNKTKYTAIAKHKDAESRKQHAEMGFEQGWSTTIDQLEILLKSQ